ncbi:MAG: TrbI/VirB10 family protein [Alphaproteobacteria bacterium]|nr:TrbI/VirB10 family protein [Alphaproteobacteria bacterium]
MDNKQPAPPPPQPPTTTPSAPKAFAESTPAYRKKAQIYLFTVIGFLILVLAFDVISKLRKEPKSQDASLQQAPAANSSVADFEQRFQQAARKSQDPLLRPMNGDDRPVLPAVLTKSSTDSLFTSPQQMANGTDNPIHLAEEKRVYLSRRAPFELALETNNPSSRAALNANNNKPMQTTEEIRQHLEQEKKRVQQLQEALLHPQTMSMNPNEASSNLPQSGSASSAPHQPLQTQQEQAAGTCVLASTTIIYATLDQVVISDYEGSWRGLITHDVYDVSHRAILIPAGSRIIGKTLRIKNINEPIQARMGMTVNKVILPTGETISFEKSSLLDQMGIGAVADTVDYHLLAQFMGVSAYVLLTYQTNTTDSNDPNSPNYGLSQSIQQQFAPIAAKYLSLTPSITLRQGLTLRIMVEDNLYLKPWKNLILLSPPLFKETTHAC